MSPKKDAMEGVPTDLTALTALPGTPSPLFVENVTQSTEWFDQFKEEEQTWFVRMLLSRMHHHQHGSVNSYLKPMLQRDFITLLPKKGLDHVAEAILGYLDAKSLCAAELVCRSWLRVISDGMSSQMSTILLTFLIHNTIDFFLSSKTQNETIMRKVNRMLLT